jgi:hypothetical protein
MKRKSAQRTKIFEVDRAALGSMDYGIVTV